MNDFHKYPELVTLDKRPEILAVREVIATEKLNGSNFRVLFPEGMKSAAELRFGSRNEVFAESDAGFYGDLDELRDDRLVNAVTKRLAGIYREMLAGGEV